MRPEFRSSQHPGHPLLQLVQYANRVYGGDSTGVYREGLQCLRGRWQWDFRRKACCVARTGFSQQPHSREPIEGSHPLSQVLVLQERHCQGSWYDVVELAIQGQLYDLNRRTLIISCEVGPLCSTADHTDSRLLCSNSLGFASCRLQQCVRIARLTCMGR